MKTLKEMIVNVLENHKEMNEDSLACVLGSIMMRSKITDYDEIDEANEYLQQIIFF